MKLSARNILPGTVTAVKKGTTTAHVTIDIGGGRMITASITNEAVDELGLKKGDKASAITKATEIIVGKEGGPAARSHGGSHCSGRRGRWRFQRSRARRAGARSWMRRGARSSFPPKFRGCS